MRRRKIKTSGDANKVIEFSGSCIPGTDIRVERATYEDLHSWLLRVNAGADEAIRESIRQLDIAKAHSQTREFIMSRVMALAEAERRQAALRVETENPS